MHNLHFSASPDGDDGLSTGSLRRPRSCSHSGGMDLPPGAPLTTAALTALGYDAHARRRLCSSGQLRRITHGVYVVAEAAPATFAEQRRQYLQRAGALMAALPGTYLVGPSACLAQNLPLLNPPSAIHLSRERQLHSNRAGVVSRRPWPHSVEPVDGLMTQQATAAVIEVAALEGTLAGLVPADVAARRGLLLDTDALLDAWGRRRGSAHARAALALADGRRESVLETRVAWAAALEGIALDPQLRVLDERGGFVARADFVVRGHRVIVEVDGLGKYRHDGDLRAEKLRQSDLERLGWVVVRIMARDIDAVRVGALLRDAIRHADALFGPSAA